MGKNVLYLVLDCLRSDLITPEITPTISQLKKENLSLESCVAPANWSLPSHASIFTGEYPHSHHIFNKHHEIESLPLIQSFSDRGYRTVGITSNAYFNAHRGFDCDFDVFYDITASDDINLAGLDPLSAYHMKNSDKHKMLNYAKVIRDVINHPRPLISFKNYLQPVWKKINNQSPTSESYGSITNYSERSVSKLLDLFKQNADSRSFFGFVNFMDTHVPYQPPQRCLNAVTDKKYNIDDLRTIEPDISRPFTFLNEYYNGEINEESVRIIQSAYQAEARSVDERVTQIVNWLDEHNLREDTLIIITADHGEVLGETDLRNERSMGHVDSVSKHLWNVPLIIVNPNLPAETIDTPFSLRMLSDHLMNHGTQWVDSGSVTWAYDDSHPILFELPTNVRYVEWDTYDEHEHIPDSYSRRHTITHTVCGIDNNWFIAAESSGKITTWLCGKKRDENKAPSDLVSACQSAVRSFPDEHTTISTEEISDKRQEQLEWLGYK